MNKLIKTILSSLILMIAFNCSAQSRYNLIYEQQMGMYFAGETFVAGFHAFDYLDTLYIPKKVMSKNNRFHGVVNPLYRFGKLFFTNYILTDFAMTMNHERFGHGYRILETGGEIIEIVYNLPPPFTYQYSWIGYGYNSAITPQEQLTIDFGGSETNLVFSDVLRKNILLDERFSYNYSLAYLYGSNDAPGYTAFVTAPAGDPNQYRNNINSFYGGERLTRDKMRLYSFVSMLTDPINFYAFKSVFYDYLILGQHSTKVGMIKLSDNIKYLPRFRFEYTPYGVELVLQNYFKYDEKLFQLNISRSDGTFEPSWRILANIWNMKRGENFSFNFSGQLWQQPETEFYVNNLLLRSQGLGGQLIIGTNYDFNARDQQIGITLHSGYKTRGYSLGEQLSEGVILRGGLTLQLMN